MHWIQTAVTVVICCLAATAALVVQSGNRNRRQSCTCTVSNLPPQCSCRPLAIQGNAVQLSCACDPPRAPRCTCIHPFQTVSDPKRYCSLSCIPSCKRACEREHNLKKRCPELCTSSCSETCSVMPLITNQFSQSLQNVQVLETAKIQNTRFNTAVTSHQQHISITTALPTNRTPLTTTITPIVTAAPAITTTVLKSVAATASRTYSSLQPIVPDVIYLEKQDILKQSQTKNVKLNDEVDPVQQLISAAPQLGKALLLTAEEELERFASRAFGKLNETRATMTPQQRKDAEKVFQAINSVGQLQSLLLDSLPETSTGESPHDINNNKNSNNMSTTTIQITSTSSQFATKQSSTSTVTLTTQTPITTTVTTKTTTTMTTTMASQSTAVNLTSVLRQAFASYVHHYGETSGKQSQKSRNPSLDQAAANILNQMREVFYRILPMPSSLTESQPSSPSTPITKSLITPQKTQQTTRCITTCEESCRPQCVGQRIPLNRCILYCASACKETCKIKGL